MRARVLTCVLALGVSAAAAPQAPVPVGPPVAIEVAVLDRDGRPVPGLSADDFRIKVAGKPQPARRATYLDAAPTGGSGRVVLSNTGPRVVPRVLVLAIDDLAFSPDAGRRMLAAAGRFVGDVPDGATVGLTTTSGRVIVNPTAERRAVLEALATVTGQYRDPRKSSVANAASISLVEAIEMVEHNNQAVIDAVRQRECGGTGRGPVGAGLYATAVANYNEACANEAMRAARTIATETRETVDRQVAGVTRALEAMAPVGGLKQMVLVSAGLATTRPASVVRPIARAAAQAGVRLSVVTEDGEGVDVSESGHTLNDLGAVTYATGVSGRQTDDRAMLRSSLQALAESAGGTFHLAAGTGDIAFAQAGRAASAAYQVLIGRTADMPVSGAVEIDVAVAREGVTTHANRVAFVDRDAWASVTEADAVPLRIAVVRRQAPDARVELGVGLEAASTVAGPLALTLGLIDARGVLRQGTRPFAASADGGYAMTVPMAVDPGLYAVRVSVTDARGRVGRIDTNVDARLPTAGAVRVSDLLTWWVDGAGGAQLFAMDDVPGAADSVWAGLELYPVAGRPRPSTVRVVMSVADAGGRVVFAADAALKPGRDRTRAEANLPVRAWAAGVYRVTAQVMVDGAVAGAASAELRRR